MSKIKKGLIVAFVLVNIYGLLCGVIYFFQENLIFLPSELSQDYEYKMNYPYEEVFLNTDDGALLNGLHFQQEDPLGLILYYHGNAGNLQRWGELTEFFVEKGFDVIVMDYRGYGKSIGKRSMEALYRDSERWYEYAKEHFAEKKIIVYGRSLGTAIAIYAASQQNPAKVILEAPFYSLTAIARNRFSILPVESLLRYPFPSYRYVNGISCPITIYHGDNDEVVAIEYGKQLYDSIDKEDKEFILIPGGGHNDLIRSVEYTETIDAELKEPLILD